MISDKYLRLTSDNLSEFSWNYTTDNQLIIRNKLDNEIYAVIEQGIDERSHIADAYNLGLQKGLQIQQQYIAFLEQLINNPLTEAIETHNNTKPSSKNEVTGTYITDNQNHDADYYLYEITIPQKTYRTIQRIIELDEVKYPETYYIEACKLWIEAPASKLNTEPYAIKDNGKTAKIFLPKEQNDNYLWLAKNTGYSVRNLLYTAIKNTTDDLEENYPKQAIQRNPISGRLVENIR